MVGDVITYYENSGEHIMTRRVIAVEEKNIKNFIRKRTIKVKRNLVSCQRETLLVYQSFKFHTLESYYPEQRLYGFAGCSLGLRLVCQPSIV